MNRKIEMITDKAESANGNRVGTQPLGSNSSEPLGAIKSPEFHTTGE